MALCMAARTANYSAITFAFYLELSAVAKKGQRAYF